MKTEALDRNPSNTLDITEIPITVALYLQNSDATRFEMVPLFLQKGDVTVLGNPYVVSRCRVSGLHPLHVTSCTVALRRVH